MNSPPRRVQIWHSCGHRHIDRVWTQGHAICMKLSSGSLLEHQGVFEGLRSPARRRPPATAACRPRALGLLQACASTWGDQGSSGTRAGGAKLPTCTVAAQESGSVSGVPVSGVVVGVGVGAPDLVDVGVGDGAAERVGVGVGAAERVGVGVAGAGAGDCVPVMAAPVSRFSGTQWRQCPSSQGGRKHVGVAAVICEGATAGDPVTAPLCLSRQHIQWLHSFRRLLTCNPTEEHAPHMPQEPEVHGCHQ